MATKKKASNEAQERTAETIQRVLTMKNAQGEYVFSKNEVRDFIVASIFEMGLDIPAGLENTFINFMTSLGCDDDTEEAVVFERIKTYFSANPINPAILAELGQFARGELFQGKEGFKDDDEGEGDAKRAAGRDGKIKAPEAEKSKVDVKGKLKKGLS